MMLLEAQNKWKKKGEKKVSIMCFCDKLKWKSCFVIKIEVAY